MLRRTFLSRGALLALAATFVPKAWAETWHSAFREKELAGAIGGLFAAPNYAESADVILKAPEIAENGAVVPVSVRYTAGGARRIAVFVEENPQPLTVIFNLTDKSVADVSTRIKMGTSSLVHAVVETADGKVVGVNKEVKVTIGGCGG